MSLLVGSKILGLFFNAFTAEDSKENSCHYKENFAEPFQMQLSKKPNNFSGNLIAFLKFAWTFKNFEKKISLTA